MSDRPQFEFTGGAPCLDFINTLKGRIREPGDLLKSYSDLLDWSLQAGIAPPALCHRLARAAASHPKSAETMLHRAHTLREALFGIFSAIAGGNSPSPENLAILNRELASFLGRDVHLAPGKRRFAWKWQGNQSALEQLLWPVTESAAQLLTSPDLGRVRECAAADCAWLFLDHSHNRSRRWCDMKICGNRSKVKRFYARRERPAALPSQSRSTRKIRRRISASPRHQPQSL